VGADPQPAELTPIPREFFARETDIVARDLLGVWLLRATPEGAAGGPIVETEAYLGPRDRASHARAGRTKRTAPMFGEVGRAYVYLVYGMHNCLNVVAYDASTADAGAILIRAIEPKVGLATDNPRVAAGPALVCRALGITRDFNGLDLLSDDRLRLAFPPDDAQAKDIEVGARIGVDYAGDGWREQPLRFWLADSPAVSRSR
jgi:DNA-3-methyladenine glycosylase